MSRHLRHDEIVFKHDFYRSHKFARAGIAATGLFLCAVAHCHAAETDGYLPADALAVLSAHLGGLSDVGVPDGALTGMYVPATPEQLAQRLVEAGLLHKAPGGYQIHDYADYQETTLSRQLRRRRDLARKRARPPDRPKVGVGAESARNRSGNSGTSLYARASEPLGSSSRSTISGSDHPEVADESENSLETADYGPDLERFRRVAGGLRGADAKTPLVLASVMRGQPEAVLAAAAERLHARRGKTHLGPVANEARYLVSTIREIAAERRGEVA